MYVHAMLRKFGALLILVGGFAGCGCGSSQSSTAPDHPTIEDSEGAQEFWRWTSPAQTYTPAEQAAIDTARAWVARREGEPTLDGLPRVRLRPSPVSEGLWVTFDTPICYLPRGATREDILCGVGVDVGPDNTVGQSAGGGGTVEAVPTSVVQFVNDSVSAHPDLGAGLSAYLSRGSVTISDLGSHLRVEIIGEESGASMRVDRASGQLEDLTIERYD